MTVFPDYKRRGIESPERMRFYCVMFASMTGAENPILYAEALKKYIETGEPPTTYTAFDNLRATR